MYPLVHKFVSVCVGGRHMGALFFYHFLLFVLALHVCVVYVCYTYANEQMNERTNDT